MLVPVRCFTCGSLISDKWTAYNDLCSKYRTEKKQDDIILLDADILQNDSYTITAEAQAMMDLNIKRICCKRHFLCTVDMVDVI